MKNKLDITDWFLVIALVFYLFMGTMTTYGQELKGVQIDKSEIITITFEDGSRDKLYQNTDDGVKLVYNPMGEIKLTPKEYERFVKLIKKASKRTNAEYKEDKYIVNAYSWSDDSVYFSNDLNQIGELFIDDIDKL
jgi:lipid II:glycine glycyltransferase (peptidoglycan interpeptide bridge formation enzyme)